MVESGGVECPSYSACKKATESSEEEKNKTTDYDRLADVRQAMSWKKAM